MPGYHAQCILCRPVGIKFFLVQPFRQWVLHGSEEKCLTSNPGILGLSHTGSSGFFHGNVLGQDTSEPSLALVKPRKDMNNVSCCHDMPEILLKAACKTPFNQSINHLGKAKLGGSGGMVPLGISF